MNKRIILAGGSGFLGNALGEYFGTRDYEIIVLTRSQSKTTGQAQHITWDGQTLGEWASWFDEAEAVINLTGKSVNCRYTSSNRQEIIASRINSVNVITQAIQQCRTPPNVWVQAGSLAIYGDTGDRICDEAAPHGQGFPVETCELWEQAFNASELPNIRKVLLRTGFALGRNGGALKPLTDLTKLFLGGTAGTGRQYISWLHMEDLNRMFEWSVERPDVEGIFNATGPNPVTNAQFMRTLRHVMHRPWSPPIPNFAVRFGSLLMQTEADLVLKGRRCLPQRLVEKGFAFKYSELANALRDLVA
jgi:uncharacterized protein (TIGR01777 family)